MYHNLKGRFATSSNATAKLQPDDQLYWMCMYKGMIW